MHHDTALERTIPWWIGLLAFSALAALMISFSVILNAVVAATGASPDIVAGLTTPAGLAIQVVVVSTLFSGTALLVPRLARIPVKQWIHLTPVPPRVYLFAAVGVIGLGFLVDEVTFLLHTLDPEEFSADGLSLFNTLFTEASPVLFVLLTLAVTVGPGIGEELLFRGLLLRSFLSDMPAVLAVLFSALLFGFIHLNVLQGVGAGLIGVYLGFVVLSTGSILPAMVAHALNNFVCALFARFGGALGEIWVSGHNPVVLVAAGAVFAGALFGLVTHAAKKREARSQERLREDDL